MTIRNEGVQARPAITAKQIEAGLAWMDIPIKSDTKTCPYCGGDLYQSGCGWFCENAGVLIDPPMEEEEE